ncbi:GDSL esterase/lipase At1g28590-like isoform X1 [Ipomoea triloba]|uniref:GDSL esterase/lipase At1g28590-like isoform X1 n=1 Tax=Ipomoea triloba TaxID=35885 RepID=UPI00125D61D9|nr:GDSL esterase/lipase At1g28590-like isoform X1 [Ipomoea triloba]
MAQAYPNHRGLKVNSAISTLFLLLLLLIIPRPITAECYTSIFAFGDSLTDVGNRVILSDDPNSFKISHPPYGETFFHHPTGRCSDGRLIIDFIAEYYGLPYMPPSAAVMMNGGINGSDIEGGVNFAVVAAAAVDSAFYEERGIINTNTNRSLRVQMGWFKELLPFFCGTPSECQEKLKSSLFVVGPLGSNDYRNGLKQEKDIKEIRSYVPIVIGAISTAIIDLIELGAKTIMVPGTSPDGCLASVLTDFESSNKVDYDPDTGCLNWMNELDDYHNQHLQQQLDTIRYRNPGVDIIYADFYNISMELYRYPEKYGFIRSLAACCGVGGKYKFNDDVRCGDIGVKSCPEPWLHIEWDGYHMTERANKLVSMALLDGTCTSPPINTLCVSSPKFTYYG